MSSFWRLCRRKQGCRVIDTCHDELERERETRGERENNGWPRTCEREIKHVSLSNLKFLTRTTCGFYRACGLRGASFSLFNTRLV